MKEIKDEADEFLKQHPNMSIDEAIRLINFEITCVDAKLRDIDRR